MNIIITGEAELESFMSDMKARFDYLNNTPEAEHINNVIYEEAQSLNI